MKIYQWNIESETGYKPITTFWMDFSIADNFGAIAVEDTFERAFAEWKHNYKYLAELVLVLNHKTWQWYESDKGLAKLYNKLFVKAEIYACDNLEGEEAEYFFRVTE